jgi:hypothetical protein
LDSSNAVTLLSINATEILFITDCELDYILCMAQKLVPNPKACPKSTFPSLAVIIPEHKFSCFKMVSNNSARNNNLAGPA